ncbi:hypothetical protein B0H16DRAFT_1697694 [Mycena metata]|uniref:Uncharacterized protein n=1 Tax=Mycena metata TaxID=1033252 RepID=A0AAD7MRH5_9AGAR|nr:hypothetical protein B0H16DRAFT_1697694 [Mycena metata]
MALDLVFNCPFSFSLSVSFRASSHSRFHSHLLFPHHNHVRHCVDRIRLHPPPPPNRRQERTHPPRSGYRIHPPRIRPAILHGPRARRHLHPAQQRHLHPHPRCPVPLPRAGCRVHRLYLHRLLRAGPPAATILRQLPQPLRPQHRQRPMLRSRRHRKRPPSGVRRVNCASAGRQRGRGGHRLPAGWELHRGARAGICGGTGVCGGEWDSSEWASYLYFLN